MNEPSSRALTVRFGRGFNDGPDPEELDPPCPEWFTGQVPAEPSIPGIDFGDGDDSAEDPTKLRIAFESHSAGKMMGNWGSDTDGSPHTSLTVSFGDEDDDEKDCPNWASILCWRPIPLDYIGFYVSDVRYAGNYAQDMDLPSITGSYDPTTNQITLEEIEIPGEEEEETTKVKPSIRIMWPPGDLKKFINLEHYLNPWYEIETRVRTKMPEGESLPTMWTYGPIIGGDEEGKGGSPTIYALRVPVVFTFAEGEAAAVVPSGATGIETYRELLTAEDAFKPTGDGLTVQVADVPKPGEEYNGPGIDLNEAGLNEWLASRSETADPLTADTYTLLMEIRPAWGRYSVKAKYLCHDNIMDLAGEHRLSREPSIFLNYPLYKVPVAYLKLSQGFWIEFRSLYQDGSSVVLIPWITDPEPIRETPGWPRLITHYRQLGDRFRDHEDDFDGPTYYVGAYDVYSIYRDFGISDIKFVVTAMRGGVSPGPFNFDVIISTYKPFIENYYIYRSDPEGEPYPYFVKDKTEYEIFDLIGTYESIHSVTATSGIDPGWVYYDIGYCTVHPNGQIEFEQITPVPSKV